MKRHRAFIEHLALVALVMQVALGTVAPGAVLCISHPGSSSCSDEPSGAQACAERACCPFHAKPREVEDRGSIALTPPCDDDCSGCTDIGLADLDMLSSQRVDLPPAPVGALNIAVIAVEAVQRPRSVLPTATGPPRLRACPHAPVLNSTRLLI